MNQRADFIIPECYVDTNLVETLVCHAGCNHQKGCNQVAKVMQEKFPDRFAVGIIDADKRRPGYLKEFCEIASCRHIQLYRHSSRPHFIIMICPAIDVLILACAEVVGVDLTQYDLSPILKEFTSQTKNVLSNKDHRFKSLFKAIRDANEMQLLESLISCLISDKYKVNNDSLVAIFKQFQP